MPRRLRRIFRALVALAMAGLCTWFFLSWRVREPLTFRIERVDWDTGGLPVLHYEVANASAFPVLVDKGIFRVVPREYAVANPWRSEDDGFWFSCVCATSSIDPATGYGKPLLMKSGQRLRGSTEFRLILRPGQKVPSWAGPREFQYYWYPTSRDGMFHILHYVNLVLYKVTPGFASSLDASLMRSFYEPRDIRFPIGLSGRPEK